MIGRTLNGVLRLCVFLLLFPCFFAFVHVFIGFPMWLTWTVMILAYAVGIASIVVNILHKPESGD
jgi:ABC-type multidrug transport system permease subunit